MLLFKLLFSQKYRTLRKLIIEVRSFWSPSTDDEFLNQMKFFSYIFYTSGFLGINQKPAFPNAYKNISPDVFKKTYIALPLYYVLRFGIKNSNFTSIEETIAILSQKCPSLDINSLKYLSSKWCDSSHDDLDKKLFQHFNRYGIFDKVFAADEDEVYIWFKNYLNQIYNYISTTFVTNQSLKRE